MLNALIKKVKRVVLAAIMGLLISGGSSQPAHAIPVVDMPHIATAVVNTADQIARWATYIQTFRGYYSTFNAVYQGIKNWNEMGWLDLLQLAELPCFDGLGGIDDLRNICSGVDMTVQDLNHIFSDVKWFERMMNDPAYAKSEAFRERTKIMRMCASRSMRRKMVITRVMKNIQRENDRLQRQARTIQTNIQTCSAKEPVPTGEIQALNAKLLVIQTKMQTNKETVYAQLKQLEEQQQAEMAQLQSQLQCNIDDLRQNNKELDNYWNNMVFGKTASGNI